MGKNYLNNQLKSNTADTEKYGTESTETTMIVLCLFSVFSAKPLVKNFVTWRTPLLNTNCLEMHHAITSQQH